MAKVFIAGGTTITDKFFEKVCEQGNHDVIYLNEKKMLIEEIEEKLPDILFIHASLIDELGNNIIETIQNDDKIGFVYTVLFASRSAEEMNAFSYGVDGFLPLPFCVDKLSSMFRLALHSPKKILLVSAETEETSGLLQKLLDNESDITLMSTAREALEYARNSYPDLIVCNNNLPDVSAALFCAKIKSLPDLQHIQVISLTENDPNLIGASLEAGVEKVLTPPFDSENNIQYLLEISFKSKAKTLIALVVDDSTVVRNVIAKNLKKLGIEVILAKDGLEGLEKIEKFTPDLITSDYEMPNMDGWEFCTEVKKNKELDNIPIIMITSKSDTVDIKKGDVLGVSAYLTKPFKDKQLQHVVTDVLEEARKKQEKAALSKYIAVDTLDNVANTISGDKVSKTEEKFISILFSDICGFTEKSERLGANKIINLLNKYFDCMVETLSKYDAIIDKFIGDAIVVRYDSGDHETDAYNAVKSAMSMLENLAKLNETLDEEINIRIGVNSGNVFMGDIGSAKYRLEYAMIGDNVNISQRLESQAPTGGCLISNATRELLKDKVEVHKGNEIRVKGRNEPVKCFVVAKIK